LTTKKYQLSVHWARLVFEVLKREGLDTISLFKQCGLDVFQLTNPDAYFDVDRFSKLWHAAAQLSGNPAIGLKMGVNPPLIALGDYSSSTISSSTLREALVHGVQYQKVIGSAAALTVDDTDEGCRITLFSHSNDLPPATQGYDAALSIIVTSLGLITSQPIQPLYAEFCYPQPDDLGPYQAIFNCPLHFSAERYSFCFDNSVLDEPLIFANKSLSIGNEKRLTNATKGQDDVSLPDRVYHFIEQSLSEGEPSVQQAAQALHMTPRTLQRNLRQEGVSFRSLLDKIRKGLAQELMDNPKLELQEISFLLGFSEPSNFYRAFRRWYGCTPGSFRLKQSKGK